MIAAAASPARSVRRPVLPGRVARGLRVWLGTLAGMVALALVLWPAPALAFTPPSIQGHVTDLAGKLTPDQRADLEARMEAENRDTGDEIAVLILPALDGETIEDVGYATINAWKLGKHGKDNGVLLALALADHRVRIETGKGVEGQLTDLQTQDIIQLRIVPMLKQDRFYEAIRDGTDAIAMTLSGHAPALPREMPPRVDRQTPGPVTIIAFLLLAALILWLRMRGGGGGGGFWYGGGGGWGGGGGGGWGGGGGGGDGGGFTGGGGSGGGGGSSGSW